MSEFMVVCTFKPGTDMSEVMAVVAQERAVVADLQAAGSLGVVKLATPQGKVFLEVHAEDADTALLTVESLPMAAWWNIEVYAIVPPAPSRR